MVTHRTIAAVMRAMAMKQSAHLRRETPMVDQFLADYTPFLKDFAERAAKTFAGGFIVGAHLVQAATTTAWSEIDWAHGLDIGAGTTVASMVFSLASLKFGTAGTASLTKAVQKSPRRKAS